MVQSSGDVPRWVYWIASGVGTIVLTLAGVIVSWVRGYIAEVKDQVDKNTDDIADNESKIAFIAGSLGIRF